MFKTSLDRVTYSSKTSLAEVKPDFKKTLIWLSHSKYLSRVDVSLSTKHFPHLHGRSYLTKSSTFPHTYILCLLYHNPCPMSHVLCWPLVPWSMSHVRSRVPHSESLLEQMADNSQGVAHFNEIIGRHLPVFVFNKISKIVCVQAWSMLWQIN